MITSLSVHAFPINIDSTIKLLCIHILPSKTKPVFIKDRAPLGGKACFKRTGSSTVAMSVQEIKNLLISYQETYFDESPVKNTNINNLDFNTLSKLLPNLIHKRDWRNPLLAELMKKFGFGEMDGQGIDRPYASTLKIKVPPPVFIDQDNSFTTTLSAPKLFEDFSLEEKRLMIIIMIIMHEHIDNKTIRHYFDISSEKASTLIKSLVAERVIQSSGQSRKYAKYILTEQYREKVFG